MKWRGVLLLLLFVGACFAEETLLESVEASGEDLVLDVDDLTQDYEIFEFEPHHCDKAVFQDDFQGELEDKWTVTEHPDYTGPWVVEEPEDINVITGDKMLVMKRIANKYGISAKFDSPIELKDKPLVVQYEVKLQRILECGGAYVKLIRETPDFDQSRFSSETPYVIMFGPDKCGLDNDKVHLIFNHRNPVSGEYEEKHSMQPPKIKSDNISHLYTLIVRPDSTYEILIDLERVKAGSMHKDVLPPVTPPQEIDDPDDFKPADWIDDEMMDDPEASKPEDWDEDEPEYIADADATMPDTWHPDEPEMVPDPEAEKPEEWDDEEDGEWFAPVIPNPLCAEGNCGEWRAPMIKNPLYKGKWVAPKVKNPLYKGEWRPRRIQNPNYFVSESPFAELDRIIGLGFELWTMTSHIAFDNVYVGHDIEAARAHAEATFMPRHREELKIAEAAKKIREQLTRERGLEMGNAMDKMRIYLEIAAEKLQEHMVPVLVSAAALLVLLCLCCCRVAQKSEAPAPASAPAPATEEEEEEEGEETTAAASEADRRRRAPRAE
eukprot:gnl/Trimastix_PCT/411.p2 GENE.gnl/Trimastix_PCT/411~~gnl/Trimastix_PCT/411.p2  ORF type:complete len:550 (-),score=223.57 gnl/Trimastix_PCT/411:55-1704(-)